MTVEDGFVPTPPTVADYMASTLFTYAPSADDRILFPGAGTGCLAAAVQRYCSVRGFECPDGVAVDTSADRLATLEEHVATSERRVPPLSRRSKSRLKAARTTPADRAVSMEIETQVGDFLLDPPTGEFDYIIANPPYTRYEALDAEKRHAYGDEFETAVGNYSLYMPFVEQMQRLLADDGNLVFIAPVGYLIASTAATFREELRRDTLHEFMQLPGGVFPNVRVEPVVTTVESDPEIGRDGSFWVQSFHYESRVADLLRDVGVTDGDDRAEAVEGYYKSVRHTKWSLNWSRSRDGKEGGYNVSRIPAESRPNDSHQSDIGRWA